MDLELTLIGRAFNTFKRGPHTVKWIVAMGAVVLCADVDKNFKTHSQELMIVTRTDRLAGATLAVASAVAIAATVATLQIFPLRSLGSLAIGATMIALSFSQLVLVPLLLVRTLSTEAPTTKIKLLCLLSGTVSSIPAIKIIGIMLTG
jgi:hypothetical protein